MAERSTEELAGGKNALYAAPEEPYHSGVGAAGDCDFRNRRHVLLGNVRQVLTGGGHADSGHRPRLRDDGLRRFAL